MTTNASSAPCHDRSFWQAFDASMLARGWRKSLLFMRGVRWTRDADVLIYDSLGWQLNGQPMSEDELFQSINLTL